MKVLHVIKVAGLGGAEVYLSKILPELNKAGVQCTLLAMVNPNATEKAKKVTDLIRSLNVEVIEIIVKNDFSISMYKEIARVIQQGQFNLINVHLVHAEMYLAMVKRLFIKNLKVIATKHGYSPEYQVKYGFEPVVSYTDKFWWISKFNGLAMNRTITISRGLKNLIVALKIAKDSEVDVIHYGFDYGSVNYSENTEQFRKSSQQLIILGRLEEVKGHTMVFQALPTIIKKFPNLKLVIIGSGIIEEKLKQEVIDRGIESHVEFLGFQTQIHDFLKNSDVTIIPSFAEGFCAVVLESFFNHTPVVCFDVPALNEIVDNDVTGVIVPKFNIDILADKIIELLENKDKVEGIVNSAFHKLNSYFSMDRMLRETIEVYQKVLSDK
ncbi:MAG: glycosyltransferase family 4 protein [Chitinophagales bacterium]|nr:glycosyltransferase family 4 protein [Chitinophagales bacterium]